MCSNMNAIFVLSATIYCIGLIISSNYCLGSHNLIEFVEEWGCYDSEIRLTCGHLDSKIAILEATFAPNCTQEKCIKGDLKRLIRGHSNSKKISSRSAATEAARKFLETLRHSDFSNNAELVDGNLQDQERPETIPHANHLIGTKHKRASLRASLERLIIKYLRQISPGENFEEYGKRLKRFRRELLSLSEPDTESQEVIVDQSISNRLMIGSRNVSFEDYEMQDRPGSSEERYRKYYENRSFCADQRRKIGTLSRLELDESLRRKNDTRQNIRKILNKRCSGKNHCSFLFAADDPLAVLWDSGLVHVKYVCMDDYHTNHYCNEHLTIGYDSSPKRRQVNDPAAEIGEPRAEARVQSRDQVFHSVKILKPKDDGDVEEIPAEIESVPERRRPSEKLQKARKKEKGIYSQDFKVLKILPSNLDDFNDIEEIGDEIYFRTDENTANTDIFPSILVPTALTLASEASTREELRPLSPRSTAGYPNSLENNSNGFSGNANRNDDLSKFDNITMIIREGEQYFVTYPSPRILDNMIALNKTASVNSTASSTTPIPPASTTIATATSTLSSLLSSSSILTSQSSILLLSPPSTMPPSSIIATTISSTNPPPLLPPTTEEIPPAFGASSKTFVESETIDSRFDSEVLSLEQLEEIAVPNEQDIETAVPTVGELSMEASGKQFTTVITGVDESILDGVKGDRDNGDADGDQNSEDELDELDAGSEEDFFGITVRKQYKSIQRTYYGPPKPQGFTMTPGYPKFYIGDCECMWKILAPVSQRIRLTILDISLRHEKNCQDYLKIVDMKTGKTLFKSCEEPNWPTEIVSSSNQVQIIVKAKTKFAYPKRGVLIHYSALGCLTPPPPMHGRFVARTDEAATYECESSFVFPDSAISTRQLWCTEQHTWNATLPDCVEEDAVSGGGFESGLNINLHKTQSATSAKMGHAETDTVFDIIVPTILIVGLFAINAVIFVIIMKQRKRSANQMDVEAKELELAEL